MKIKNIIISLSSVLIISAALPAIAHQDTQHSDKQGEAQVQEVFTPHTDKSSATDMHYMMHSGGDHQGHLMEGAKHGENQATEHEKQLMPSSPSNSEASEKVLKGYPMEGTSHQQ